MTWLKWKDLWRFLGAIDLANITLEEREFLASTAEKVDYSKEPEEPEEPKDLIKLVEELKKDKECTRFDKSKKIYSTRY